MDQITFPQLTDIPDFHSRGYLPHIENKMMQVITFRLYDSVPRQVIDQWKTILLQESTGTAGDLAREQEKKGNAGVPAHKQEKKGNAGVLARTAIDDNKANIAANEAGGDTRAPQDKDVQKKMRKLIDDYEDKGYGQCFFRDNRIAELMERALFHYEGKHYKLVRWVIMPNHVHVMIVLKPGVTLSTIVQEWKSYTAHAANRLLGRKGDFWMPEFYDRYIRDNKHMANAIAYIDANPVKAGIAQNPNDYRWSSAYNEDKEQGNAEQGTAGVLARK